MKNNKIIQRLTSEELREFERMDSFQQEVMGIFLANPETSFEEAKRKLSSWEAEL